MKRSDSERALRRLVADLARLDTEDVEAILDELRLDQGRKVRGLIAAFRGEPVAIEDAEETIAPAAPAPDLSRFSQALAERVQVALNAAADRAAPATLQPSWRMTSAAQSALAACAAEVLRTEARFDPARAPALSRRRRLVQAFAARRRAA